VKGLPTTTKFNRRIPKEKFYSNMQVNSKIKRCFVEQIKSIYWRSKIAPSTTNLKSGKIVEEIQIFEISLKTEFLDEGVLLQIDREIPYHLLFILEYKNRYQAWIAYKEVSAGNMAFKVNQYYHTEWLNEEKLPIKLEGLNMDSVYENFVYQIAGNEISRRENLGLQDNINLAERIKKLKKQIEILETKIRNEPQLNIQFKLNSELKEIKKEFKEITNGKDEDGIG